MAFIKEQYGAALSSNQIDKSVITGTLRCSYEVHAVHPRKLICFFLVSTQSGPGLSDPRLIVLGKTAGMVSILITGAASGIGRALALRLSEPGTILHLGDIALEGLQSISLACIEAGAKVFPRAIDISDAASTRDWMRGCGQLDLVLGCAGIQYTSLVGAAETAEQTIRTIEVNLLGALNTALPALDIMGDQLPDASGIRGHIVVLASQGAFVSVPGASAYCASKAALDNWTVGRAALARNQGIYMTSVCPGYIRTPMSAINDFPMHGLIEPDAAADIIVRRLRKKPVRLVFPWLMYAAARFGGLLPAGFPARVLARNYARRQKTAQK